VDDVSLSSVEKDKRFNTYGIPRNKSKVKKADEGKETVPNGNYLWITCSPPRSKRKAAPRWSWRIPHPMRATPKPTSARR
jgi:hypothetical protein